MNLLLPAKDEADGHNMNVKNTFYSPHKNIIHSEGDSKY